MSELTTIDTNNYAAMAKIWAWLQKQAKEEVKYAGTSAY